MLDPSGPLPAAVYWRRRVVAISAVVFATAATVWTVTGFVADPGLPPPVAPPPQPAAAVAPAADPAPPDCADRAVRVSVEPVAPVFKPSERVGLRMVVTNTGDHPCRRDVNRGLRELIVSGSEGQRVWSSNDCFAESTNEFPLLRPGEAVRNEVTWLRTTSAPGCPLRAEIAPAGEYSVVAKLGPLTSTPAPLRLG